MTTIVSMGSEWCLNMRIEKARRSGQSRKSNGKSYPPTDPLMVHAGKRYRMIFRNESDDAHPVHLHRHSFELTKVYGKATSGILKDTVVVNADKTIEVDFTADNPGNTLFHCHQQLHMDFGFMALLKYA